MSFNGVQPPVQMVFEIVQIPNASFGVTKIPNSDQVVLMFTLPNGRQYQFMLDSNGRKSVIQALSGVTIATPSDLPKR